MQKKWLRCGSCSRKVEFSSAIGKEAQKSTDIFVKVKGTFESQRYLGGWITWADKSAGTCPVCVKRIFGNLNSTLH